MDHDAEFSDYAASRWRALVRTGVLLGCDVAEAEDLAQQTLLRCYLKWSSVERAADREAYVARLQLNLLRQSRRRRWWGERTTDAPPERPTADGTARVDDADALRRALGRLPETQRQAVVLRHYLHLTEQQTAEATGVARGTVKSRTVGAGDDGKWEIYLPPGTYRVLATSPGYGSTTGAFDACSAGRTVTVGEGESVTVDVFCQLD